jgi:hypothetical protein
MTSIFAAAAQAAGSSGTGAVKRWIAFSFFSSLDDATIFNNFALMACCTRSPNDIFKNSNLIRKEAIDLKQPTAFFSQTP